MIVEYTRYRIDEKRRVAFLNDYRKAAASLKASKNCPTHNLVQCTQDKGRFTFRLEWDSEEACLNGFRNSAEFKSFLALVRPYVRDIEEMGQYSVTEVIEKRGIGEASPWIKVSITRIGAGKPRR